MEVPDHCPANIVTSPSSHRKAPGALDELARITGKAKSNLSRTLRTMEGCGLVRLESSFAGL
ncbi:MAG TPA: helix-turn-helix domain-containing protein [Stellaceae bacterium]|nr:helix-turn-helix domain-containing protein [Stellaceae bacterium]